MTLFLSNNVPFEVVIAAVFIFGLVIGSFLNVVILRLPTQLYATWKADSAAFLGIENMAKDEYQETLLWPSSRCPTCRVSIKPWHNIPLLSYLLLRGQCGNCQTKISLQYPVIELVTGILLATTAYHYGLQSSTIYAIIFTLLLVSLAGIDFNEKFLPDQITLPLLWLGLLANLEGTFVSLSDSVIGAMVGYLFLWAIYWLFKLLTGKEGMGYGDFKLLAALGAWLGWQMLPLVVLISSSIGAMIGILMILVTKQGRDTQIPFGPFLAFAGWIAMLWGEGIKENYLSMVGLL